MRWFLTNRIMHVLIVGKPLKEGFFMTLERESRMMSPNALSVANLWQTCD